MNAANNTTIGRARVARVTGRVLRCMRAILIRMGRDHERCGKASCARSRRCRGFACEPGRGP